jgi:hypothetical protein
VIQDVDETLKELLVQKGLVNLDTIDIRFDLPNKEWVATVTKPTINLFLYDVRENHELRQNRGTFVRSDDTGVLGRPPVRIDLSYLITAWTTDVADEHQLLGNVLTTLLQFPLVPEDVLKGALQTQPLPLQAWIAQPERTPSPWEFWGHVDHGMKAGLNFVLTMALQPYRTTDVSLVTQTVITLTPSVPKIPE